MGHSTRLNQTGGSIQMYSPDDTDDSFYMISSGGVPLVDIMERAKEKWTGILPEELSIEAEHVQTDCLGYDLYDSGDYTEYLCITAVPEYFTRI